MDVPIATYNTEKGPTNPLDILSGLACGFDGNTVYFAEAELLELYPTHEDYVQHYTAADDDALSGGFLL